MRRHKHHGFTVIELLVVIVVVALLATITTVTYRSVQADARNEKRKADAMMLRAAVEDFYADNGTYPDASSVSCSSSHGSTNECWDNEVWTMLVNRGYLNAIPTPNGKAHTTSYNILPDGNTIYGYVYRSSGSSGYAIYVPQEPISSACMVGKNHYSTWWGNRPLCSF